MAATTLRVLSTRVTSLWVTLQPLQKAISPERVLITGVIGWAMYSNPVGSKITLSISFWVTRNSGLRSGASLASSRATEIPG